MVSSTLTTNEFRKRTKEILSSLDREESIELARNLAYDVLNNLGYRITHTNLDEKTKNDIAAVFINELLMLKNKDRAAEFLLTNLLDKQELQNPYFVESLLTLRYSLDRGEIVRDISIWDREQLRNLHSQLSNLVRNGSLSLEDYIIIHEFIENLILDHLGTLLLSQLPQEEREKLKRGEKVEFITTEEVEQLLSLLPYERTLLMDNYKELRKDNVMVKSRERLARFFNKDLLLTNLSPSIIEETPFHISLKRRAALTFIENSKEIGFERYGYEIDLLNRYYKGIKRNKQLEELIKYRGFASIASLLLSSY